jgi:putative ABC transport system substrate-binding protein
MHLGRLRRREFIALLGGVVVAWAVVARAQQAGGLPRVVYVGPPATQDEREARDRLAAFRMAFEKMGWVDGRNVRIDYSFDGIASGGERSIAAEIVRSAPAVVFSTGNAPSAGGGLPHLGRP